MDLQKRYTDLVDTIAVHCREIGRDPREVQLMAVSKGQPLSKIQQLCLLGHTYYGENYAPELIEKATQLADPEIRWSFIGALQSNKIAKIMTVASEIQTLASEKHVRYVARYARELDKTPYPVFIEVNAGEEQKAGIPLSEVAAFAAFVNSEGAGALQLQGIMCVPPAEYSDRWLATSSSVPQVYAELRDVAQQTGAGLLSLGMSHDLQLAIRTGSHLVRIGTAIFGARSPA